MSSTEPTILQQLAELTTANMLEMVRSGRMEGRDSEGEVIEVPLTAAMYGQILKWLSQNGVTLDATANGGENPVASILSELRLRRDTGGLPPMEESA